MELFQQFLNKTNEDAVAKQKSGFLSPALSDILSNVQGQAAFPTSLNTSQLNLEGTNPFEPGRIAAVKEWKQRIDAGEPEGSAFDRLMSARYRALEWDAMKQGALPPGRIGGFKKQPLISVDTASQPGSPFDNMRTSQVEAALNPQVKAALNQQKAISNPSVFQQLLNVIKTDLRSGVSRVKTIGQRAADVVAPNRNKVPNYMLDVIETPEFVEAKKELDYFGAFPVESIAPGILSEKQSRWLVDPRRTPIVGSGAFGSVTVPTNTKTAFKIQENKAKAFLENELNMAARTAELELGPQVYSATLQPIQGKEGRYRGITRTEAIPHRPFSQLNPEEQAFLNLEANKLTEALYRGGISNTDNHFGNILLNDATKKAVQVDSGLARDYDPFNINDLNSRLTNIVIGLNKSGLKDVAEDTGQIGLSLINEIRTKPSPELYAEAENFFNRSGNILMNQSKPFAKTVPSAVKGTKKIPLLRTGIAADAILGYALGQPKEQALADAITMPISADAIGGTPLASIERLGPRGEFVDTRTNTVLNPQGRYTNTGIAIKGGKPIIVPRGSVAGEGNILTQSAAVLRNAADVWRKRLDRVGVFGR